jgi:LPXTG-motif cell wall-anchored protein
VGSDPEGLAYDFAKGEIFVANYFSDTLSVISDTTNTVIATVPVDNTSNDSGLGDTYTVITDKLLGLKSADLTSYSINPMLANVSAPTRPTDLAYDSGMGEIFVTNAAGTVSVISDKTNSVIATMRVGAYPDYLDYDSAQAEIFVANYESNDVVAISDTNNTVVATVLLGQYPGGVAYDPAKNEIFVSNGGPNTVSVLRDSSSSSAPSTSPTASTPISPTDSPKQTATGSSSSTLILVVAAVIIVILLMLGLLLKKRKKSTQTPQNSA